MKNKKYFKLDQDKMYLNLWYNVEQNVEISVLIWRSSKLGK